MSESISVTAFRDMDGEFQRMLEAKRYCEAHGFSYPKEVQDYFGGDVEEAEDDLRDSMLEVPLGDIVQEYESEGSDGYEVDVTRLPKEVKTLRFSRSW